MKRLTKAMVILTIFSLLISVSCNNKNDDPVKENEFEKLVVPDNFTWSTLNKSEINVTITDPDGEISHNLDGFPLDATDLQGNRLVRSSVIDGEVSFYLELNHSIESIALYSPSLDLNSVINLTDDNITFSVPDKSPKAGYIDSDGDGVYDDFDDFPYDAEIAYELQYPSPYESSTTTKNRRFSFWYYQIFEDLWPYTGDYDFNDLTLKIKMTVKTNGSNRWKRGTFDVYIWTNGASIDLGCGIDFFRYNGSRSGKSRLEYMQDNNISLVSGNYNPAYTSTDPDAQNAIIVFNNADDVKPVDYYNTGEGISFDPMINYVSFEWDAHVPQNMRAYMYLFYSDDRSHEVRTVGLPPTAGMDMNLLHTGDDDSPTTGWNWDPGNEFLYPLEESFFVTDNHHPWGIEIEYSGDLSVAFEKVDIMDAFPRFKSWAESGGTVNNNWYRYPENDPTLVFDVGNLVGTK